MHVGKVKVYFYGQLLITEYVSVLLRTLPEQHIFSEMTTRGPKRKVVADEGELKRGKMDLMVQPKLEKVEMAEVKVEKKLTHYSCPICNLKLECEPGDMVMKRHYMEKHYTSGGLLEMVALDLEEGQKLRCPYPDCDVRPNKSLFIQVFYGQIVGWKQADEAAAAEHTPGEEPQQAEEVDRAGREARSLFKI